MFKFKDKIVLYPFLIIVSLLIIIGFTDTPKFHSTEPNEKNCKYNRILCLENLPEYNPTCEAPMPYPSHTKRDVILGMFVPKKGWTEGHLEMMSYVYYLMRKIMPNVHIVLFLGKQLENIPEWDNLIKEYQIDVKYISVEEGWNMINYRFMLYKNYLIEHQQEIDRVIYCDSKDIYMLRDPFTKIGMKEYLIVGREFRSIDENDYYSYDGFYQYYNNYEWMADAYGIEFTEELKKEKKPINNGGFGGGDVQSMIKYLTLWTDEMIKIGGQKRWGYDQATLNKLVYTGIMNKELPFIHYSDCKNDRICMFSERRIEYKNGIPYLFDGCIPHLLHRDGLTYKMMDRKRYSD